MFLEISTVHFTYNKIFAKKKGVIFFKMTKGYKEIKGKIIVVYGLSSVFVVISSYYFPLFMLLTQISWFVEISNYYKCISPWIFWFCSNIQLLSSLIWLISNYFPLNWLTCSNVIQFTVKFWIGWLKNLELHVSPPEFV